MKTLINLALPQHEDGLKYFFAMLNLPNLYKRVCTVINWDPYIPNINNESVVLATYEDKFYGDLRDFLNSPLHQQFQMSCFSYIDEKEEMPILLKLTGANMIFSICGDYDAQALEVFKGIKAFI